MSSNLTIRTLCLLSIALVVTSVSHAQTNSSGNGNQSNGNPQVIMHTSVGDIVIELDAENAPQTVKNFLAYTDDNFYQDTLFHRVIEGFMIQGGGFSTTFQRKTTRAPVSNEAYNGLKNRKYSIAMARTTAPHSATSQFFINTENNSNLDHKDTTPRGWGYTVFGQVMSGFEVVDTISRVKTGSGGRFSQDVPLEPIVITGVERYMAKPAVKEDAVKEGAIKALEGGAKLVPSNTVIQDVQSSNGKTKLNVVKPQKSAPSTELVNQN